MTTYYIVSCVGRDGYILRTLVVGINDLHRIIKRSQQQCIIGEKPTMGPWAINSRKKTFYRRSGYPGEERGWMLVVH